MKFSLVPGNASHRGSTRHTKGEEVFERISDVRMTSIPLDPLERNLFEAPIPGDIRRAILNQLFGLNINQRGYQLNAQGFDAYFQHWYEDQCSNGDRGVTVSSHRDILNIINCLKKGDSKETIRAIFNQLSTIPVDDSSDETLIEGSINLAARLWSTLLIGDLKHSVTPGITIRWRKGPLAGALDSGFSPKYAPHNPIKLPKSFNAFNLEQIAGIKICWTSNLADHLSMKDDDTKVSIFHHVSFIELHRESNRYKCKFPI